MSYDLTKFKLGLNELQIELSEEQLEQFLTYYEMLIEKNKVMNLTAVTEFEDVVEKHFIDSLSLVKAVSLKCEAENPEEDIDCSDSNNIKENVDCRNNNNHKENIDIGSNYRILDLGTGAGFPGIPLKIAFPELEVTLADSLNKRILFLQEVIDELHLKKIEAVHGRAEELARDKNYREQYDLCVSRAVANLSSLTEYCLPFVKEDGLFVSYKSGEIEEEAAGAKNAVFLLGGKLRNIEKFELPGTDLKRSFVVIKKVKKTPKAYPRKAGTPTKKPL